LLRSRQRRRIRPCLCQPAVRRVPAAPWGDGISWYRNWLGHGAANHSQARRQDLGARSRGKGRDVLLYLVTQVNSGGDGMENRSILLVEDNPDDEALTLRALKKNNIKNEVVVAHNGAEALDYLFGTGKYAGRNTDVLPQVVLLDLKLPKVEGLEVLRRVRADKRTKLL